MKFMKLGSKPDGFYSDAGGEARYVASDLPSDITIHVDNVRFHLHKFPLLSKSWRLQRLALQADEESSDDIFLQDFPGGHKAFEICAKFCYGMVVTLNAYNVAAARCGADYLEMTEDMEKGNLIFKIEVFLNSSVLRSWKDSIIALQTTDELIPWADDARVVSRCIDSIVSKAIVNPSKVVWSYTCSRKMASTNEIIEAGQNLRCVPKDWWVEDLRELSVGLYKRVMVEIQSRNRMPPEVIEEALKAYAVRWLPESLDTMNAENCTESHKDVVETIISLLPLDRKLGCSCKFLLKLLKVVIIIGAEERLKEELMDRIGVQMDRASAKDLLIHAQPSEVTAYDVKLVQALVVKFMMHNGIRRDRIFFGDLDGPIADVDSEHEALIKLGKLIDSYLAEIATDSNLSVSCFIELAMSVPEAARTSHDGLYTAIDIYLKEHRSLPKSDKKRICSLMDVKKLSKEACIHAAQNDLLPLRVVVQVLFFEQIRLANASPQNATTPEEAYVEKEWKQQVESEPSSIPKQPLGDKRGGSGEQQSSGRNSVTNQSSRMTLSSRSRRIFDRLWLGGKEHLENSKSSETSGSSQSPRSTVRPGEAKSSGSSSRYWRYSVS